MKSEVEGQEIQKMRFLEQAVVQADQMMRDAEDTH